jgi:hypothetical protein
VCIDWLKRSVFKPFQAMAVSPQIEVIDKGSGFVIHSLAEILQFIQHRLPLAPGEQGGIQANDFPVEGILESMRDGDGVVRYKGRIFKCENLVVQVRCEGCERSQG